MESRRIDDLRLEESSQALLPHSPVMLPVQFDERVREVLFEHIFMKPLSIRFQKILLADIDIVMQGGIFGQLRLIEDG